MNESSNETPQCAPGIEAKQTPAARIKPPAQTDASAQPSESTAPDASESGPISADYLRGRVIAVMSRCAPHLQVGDKIVDSAVAQLAVRIQQCVEQYEEGVVEQVFLSSLGFPGLAPKLLAAIKAESKTPGVAKPARPRRSPKPSEPAS